MINDIAKKVMKFYDLNGVKPNTLIINNKDLNILANERNSLIFNKNGGVYCMDMLVYTDDNRKEFFVAYVDYNKNSKIPTIKLNMKEGDK